MKVPFLDLKRQYQVIRDSVEPVVLEIMQSCAYIGGTYVERFEHELCRYLNVKHAIGCGNGTDALVLALRACNVRAGDEVITSPFTFFATAEAIASIGAVPVFVDICEDNFTIDCKRIEDKITPKTKVILPVHIFGFPCDMDSIMELARRHSLKVIEDAAQAIGCEYKGQKIGSTADIACFSFYPTKNLGGFGDGGMVTTNNDDLATILKALREHGAAQNGARARELLEGERDECATNEATLNLYNPYKYFNYIIGYNSRLDAVQAGILSVKLQHLDQFNQARSRIASLYTQQLCSAVTPPCACTWGVKCNHQYVIKTNQKDELCSYLAENGIGVGTFYPVPLHLQKAFINLGYRQGDLPVAEAAAAQTVCLPIFPELTDTEVWYVIETINRFFA